MKKPTQIKPLFHYTTQAGLLGIIDSRSLWFTDIFYLNDSTEMEYTFSIVGYVLSEKFGDDSLWSLSNDDQIIRFIENSSLYKFVREKLGLYVFSFSKKPDDLSQWRAYSNNGGGYCIEFDTNKITEIANKHKWGKAICIYNEKRQQKKLKPIIEKAITACNNIRNVELFKKYNQAIQIDKLTPAEDKELNDIRMEFNLDLLKLAPKLKHETFREEAEVRMYVFLEKSKNMLLKFRPGKTMLIPYLNFPIAQKGEEMPIRSITIGPTNHPELSKKAVRDLLMANSMECEVTLSEIPYRDIL